MKTFEERYTAWIDGELEGAALVAFEQELERRASVPEAAADKADALHLSAFLHEHLLAPPLTNGDFFNHQLLERIAGERAAVERGQGTRTVPAPVVPWFSWSLPRLGLLGTACLFIAGALYYGMMPRNLSPGAPEAGQVALGGPAAGSGAKSGAAVVAPADATAPAVTDPARTNGDTQRVDLSKEQQQRQERADDLILEQQKKRVRDSIEPGTDIQARVPEQAVPPTATALHYKDPNVNVLWVNGLDYLPDASALDSATTPPTTNLAPAATATP